MVAIQFSGTSDEVLADFRALAVLILGGVAAVLNTPEVSPSNTEKKTSRAATRPTLTSVPPTTENPVAGDPTPVLTAPAPATAPPTQKAEDPFHIKLTAELIAKKGVTVTKKVLDSYKVAKASLLSAEQIPAYVKEVEALIVAR